MRSAIKVLVVAGVVFASLSPALSSDEDPAALLRQARVADEVEKDSKKARDLYARVWALAPQTPIGMHAGLRLSELTTDKAKRLELLKDLTKRHTTRMSDEQKKHVHDAIAALIEPGQNEMTPLGMVFVRGTENDGAAQSPVERKVAQIFKAHNVRALPLRRQSEAVYRDLDREMAALGEPGRLVLLRLANEGHPDEAFAAGILLLRSEPEAAVAGYVRAIRHGRATFRSRVLRAANAFPKNDVVSPRVTGAFLPLLWEKHVQELHRQIVRLVAGHLNDAQLVTYCKQSGPQQWEWVRWGLSRGLPGAFEALMEAVAAGRGPQDGRQRLFNALWSHRSEHGKPIYFFDLGTLDQAKLLKLYAMMVAAQAAGQISGDYQGWRRLGDELRKRGSWDDARLKTWRLMLDSQDAQVRRQLANSLAWSRATSEKPHVSAEAFRSDKDWERLLDVLIQTKGHGTLANWMVKSERLWRVVVARMRALGEQDRPALEQAVRALLGKHVPKPVGPACLDFVASLDHGKGWQSVPRWVWTAAAETVDPRFVELIEKNLEHLHRWYAVRMALEAYRSAEGDVVPFAMRVLDAEHKGLNSWALAVVHGAHEDPDAWQKLRSVPRTPSNITVILSRLMPRDPKQRTLLQELYAWASEHAFGDDRGWRDARRTLTQRASSLRLKEAIPYLLRAYRSPQDEAERAQVAEAMDAIRKHHDRLVFFESWGGGEDDERKVEAMLDEQDAALRRAAVLSLAALQGPRALPRLLEIAKSDADENVRKAALEAIERVATTEPAKGE